MTFSRALLLLILASDYTPPADFDRWLACAFYVIALLVALKHYQMLSSGNLLSRDMFNVYQKHAEEDRKEIKDGLSALEGKIEAGGTSQYNARRRMHKQLNAHANALHFIAGQHNHGAEIKRILDSADKEADEADNV